MMKVIGCPPQKIKIMAGQKDYDDIWSRAWKQMYNVEPEDKAKWKDFPAGSNYTGQEAIAEHLAVPVKA